MANIIQQLEDLKEWAQDPTRYARRLAFRSTLPYGEVIDEDFDELSIREDEYYRKGPWKTSREDYQKGQLVEPRQGFYKKGFVKSNRLTKEEIDQRYKEKKLRENPKYKAEADQRWKAKKLKENPDWNLYQESSIYRKRIEAKKKGLVYDIKTGETRKAQPTGFQKTYHKFEAADKKLIKEWKKTLTDAAKTGDMSQTTGFKDWLTKKFS